MSESVPVDSAPEEQEQPDGSPEVSQPDVVSEEVHLPEGAALAQDVLKDEVATETLRRHFQGTKDKGVAEANKKATEALSEVEQLKSYFSEEDQAIIRTAQTQLVLDELYNQRYSQPVPGTEPTAEVQAPASSVDIIKALEDTGYNMSSVTLADIEFGDTYTDQAKLKRDLKVRILGKPADPASVVQPGGGGTLPTKVDKDALLAESRSLDGKPMDMKLESGQTVLERRTEISKLVN